MKPTPTVRITKRAGGHTAEKVGRILRSVTVVNDNKVDYGTVTPHSVVKHLGNTPVKSAALFHWSPAAENQLIKLNRAIFHLPRESKPPPDRSARTLPELARWPIFTASLPPFQRAKIT